MYDKFGKQGINDGPKSHGGVDLMDLLSGRTGGRQRGQPKAKAKLYPLELTLQ